MKKTVCLILTLIFTVVAAFGGYQIYQNYLERQESDRLYSELEELVPSPEDFLTDDNESAFSYESGEDKSLLPEDFENLIAINDDFIGWLYIEDTEISYPVVQGADNSYYLKHLFNGTWNSSGCIFLDCRVAADLSDRHSIIYGHHMKNGTMFSGLTQYKQQQYFEEHPNAYFITPNGTYCIDFFSGYVASINDTAWNVSFESDEDFDNWMNDVKSKSLFTSPLSPAITDRILTLSTCSYEFDNARFVLHGIITERNAATD